MMSKGVQKQVQYSKIMQKIKMTNQIKKATVRLVIILTVVETRRRSKIIPADLRLADRYWIS